MTLLCARYAGEQSFPEALEATIETTVPTVYQVSTWTLNQATGKRIAAALWSR